jgi:outer membrane murein-binding lipoprotein Lpp
MSGSTYTNQLMVFVNGKLVKISAADNLSIGGSFTAASFSGSASGLTNIPSAQLEGALPAIDGSALTALSSSALSGALPAIDGSALTVLSSSALVGALPALDASALTNLSSSALVGALPAIDGSAVTGLDAAHLASGTVSSDRISGQYSGISGVGTLVAGAWQADAIADTYLQTITAAGKVENSATSATDLNTAGAIVARDGSGNFSANIISAALNGNASTSSQWADARSVTFATGDVTGSFSIDGSGNVDNVALSIGSGVVTNAMLAGGISDDKLDQITTPGKVADSALSSNVAFLNGNPVAFQNDVTIGGSLTVTGPIYSGGAINSVVANAFLDLAAGNTGTQALAGGLNVNIKKATGFSAVSASAFTAAVAGVSDATVVISGGSALALGDVISVSGSTSGTNDGLYIVYASTGSLLTLKSIGLHAPASYVPWARSQVTTSTGETAQIVKIDLAVFAVSNGSLYEGAAAIPVGEWCYAYAAAATEADFDGGYASIAHVVQSLQAAYDGGDGTIALSNAKPFVINYPTLGNAGFSINGSSNSNLSVNNAALLIEAEGSGDVELKVASGWAIKASGQIMLGDSVGFVQSVAAGVGDFELLYVDSSGVAQKISSAMQQELDCVSLEANGGGSAADKKVASVLGAKVYVTVSGSAAVGDLLYVSATAGEATATVPTSGRIIKVGKVIGAAVGSHYPIIYQPQYIADV